MTFSRTDRLAALIVVFSLATFAWVGLPLAPSAAQSDAGPWQRAQSMPFQNHASVPGAAAVLPDGKVLRVGNDENGNLRAGVYDPSAAGNGQWTDASPQPPVAGTLSNLAMLPPKGRCASGCALVQLSVGSQAGGAQDWRLFRADRPPTQAWSRISSAFTFHRNFGGSVSALEAEPCGINCGNVLVAGGQRGSGGFGDISFGGSPETQASVKSAELYDPVNDRWLPTGAPRSPRAGHGAVLLKGPDCGLHCGRVLVVGGGLGKCPGGAFFCPDSPLTAELYDPVAGGWVSAPPPKFRHDGEFAITALADGRVLVADMAKFFDPFALTESHSEIFDPAANGGAGEWVPVWTQQNETDECQICRRGVTATVLSSGKVLLIGEFEVPGEEGVTTKWQLFDSEAASDKWSEPHEVPMQTGGTHSATLVRGSWAQCKRTCGKILVAGGRDQGAPGPDPRPLGRLFVPAPELDMAEPAKAAVKGGTAVTVEGSGLASLQKASIEGAGHMPCGETPGARCSPDPENPDGVLHLVTPPRPQGVGKLTVDSEGGTSNPLDLEFLPTPEVTTIVPPCGPLRQESPVTLKGTDLTRARTVKFGTVERPFTVNATGTELLTTSPAQASPGPVDVSVGSEVGGSSIRMTFPCPPVTVNETGPDGDDLIPVPAQAQGAGDLGAASESSGSAVRPAGPGGPGAGGGQGTSPATPPTIGPGTPASVLLPESALAPGPEAFAGPGFSQGQAPAGQPHIAPGSSPAVTSAPAAFPVEPAEQLGSGSPARRHAMRSLPEAGAFAVVLCTFGLLFLAGSTSGLSSGRDFRRACPAAGVSVAR